MEDPNVQQDQITRLTLDLRGSRFTIEQEMLMSLPESVLLCLFPNGLVLSRQPGPGYGGGAEGGEDANGEMEDDDEEEEVYMVDFDPACLSYVLSFFKSAQEGFYGLPGQPSRRALLAQSNGAQHFNEGDYDGYGGGSGMPLMSKQAIIVLREELEYFSIPTKGTEAAKVATQDTLLNGKGSVELPANDVTTPALLKLKQESGAALLKRKQIFTALQRNVNKENNMAEQHLIDMLCMSGFDREDVWGFRALEPSRCCITSIALVLLKTGISVQTKEGAGEGEGEIEIDQQQLNTAQKLLLFWRKPARKCWWDGVDVILPLEEGETMTAADVASANTDAMTTAGGGMTPTELDLLKTGKGRRTRVWARRVWTLELSLVSSRDHEEEKDCEASLLTCSLSSI
ncbi:hypothetical protein CBS101457_002453 [Exobasidium rhododendri]|nr:hypothetical protein CBS101457_002453 [Exobasidium rhododendri]